MSIKKHSAFIDTNTLGSIIVIEHNLGGTPLVQLTDYTSGQEVLISLYDSRIGQIKVLNENNLQVTFAGAFRGYIYLYQVDIDNPSDHDRIVHLEERLVSLYGALNKMANRDQWSQMNTYFSQQIADVKTSIEDIRNRVTLIETEQQGL